MNFQELLMRLSASCFAADRPDYDWKTLRLFPETGLDLVLIVRLAAALILCVIGALVHNTVVQYILLALSALAAGYDYLASAIAYILDRQVFRPAVIVIVCVIGTMAVGQPVDAAVFLLVYRVMSILIAVVTVHAQKTLEAAVGGEIHSPAEFAAPKWIGYLAPAGLCIAVLVAVLEIVLKVATGNSCRHDRPLSFHPVCAADFCAAGVVQCRQRCIPLRRAVSQLPQHARAQRRACGCSR